MPKLPDPYPAERTPRDAVPPPPRPARLVPSTGAIRVLQNRRAPAQLSLFQRALPAR